MSGANYNQGNNADTLTMTSTETITQIFAGQIFSGGAGAAYAENVAAGSSDYGYTLTSTASSFSDRRAGAAAFYVIPEPATMVLLASGCLLMAGRRRQKA